MIQVKGSGPLSAAMVVVGEAPGTYEVERGQPFVGPSGQLLERWLHSVGLHRSEIRFENVVEEKLPNNDIRQLSALQLETWTADCRERLSRLVAAKIFVPLGNTALTAVTGKKGISKWRGTFLKGGAFDGRDALPSLHPAAILRQPYWEKRCRKDWAKIVQASRGDVQLPQRSIRTRPTLDDVQAVIERMGRSGAKLAIDIETPGGHIACVGVAESPTDCLVIPTNPAYWGDRATTAAAWRLVQQICALSNEKVFQNGHFDTYWLRMMHGITVTNWRWDTLAMHHCLDAAEDHDLAFMASVATWEPFWKEWDDKENLAKYPSDIEALWHYNGIDACVTHELYRVFRGELERRERVEFYDRHYASLFDPILDLMCHGVLVDDRARRKQLTRLLKETTLCEQEFIRQNVCIVGKQAISPKKLLGWLKSVGIKPPTKRRPTGAYGETVDEHALRKLMLRNPKVREVGTLVLRHRGAKKQSEFLDPKRLDADGRLRSSYKFTTDTGRFASSKNPRGTGANAQNIDRTLRTMFVADPGCVLLKIDLSQAEKRFVDMLTGDKELREMAQSPPWEFDAHSVNAALIFKKAEHEITKDERYLGKKAVHACLTPDHEVLTPRGWQPMHQTPAKLMVWSAINREMWFETPRRWTAEAYEGPMISIEGSAVSQVMTPNHRLPYESNSRVITGTMAPNLPKTARLLVNGWHDGNDKEMTVALARMLVAVQADGSILRPDRVRFHLKKQRKIDRLHEIARTAGFATSQANYRNGTVSVMVEGQPETPWVKHWNHSLLSWSFAAKQAWLEELHHWDGTLADEYLHRREAYFAKDRADCEWVQTIAHCVLRQSKILPVTRAWTASINSRKAARLPKREDIDYQGDVFCPTVSTGNFLVRRNGKISVTSNSNYGMMGKKLAEVLLNEGYDYPATKCQQLIDAYLNRFPAIREWQTATRARMLRDRVLTNSWGRERRFDFDRLDDDAYRQGYAFRPQAETIDLLNQLGFIPLWERLRHRQLGDRKTKICLHVHDELTINTPPGHCWDIAKFLNDSIGQPRLINGYPLSMYCEFGVGPHWKGTMNWKKLPTKNEMTDAAMACMEQTT